MPTYALKYQVNYVDTIPYEAHPEPTTSIAGYTVKLSTWQTATNGINRSDFQGLVDVSGINSSELFSGFSYGPLGTIWYSSARFNITDPALIPAEYVLPSTRFGTTGPGGMFAFTDAQKNEAAFGPVKFDFTTDSFGTISFGSFAASTKDTIYTLAENAFSAAGLSGIGTAIKNVATAKTALDTAVPSLLGLVTGGVERFGEPWLTHRSYDMLAEEYMLGAGDAFQTALIDQTLFPGNPVLESYGDAVLNGIRLVGSASTTTNAGLAAQLVFRVEAGPVTFETSFKGSASADFIIQPGRGSIVIEGGNGNDYVVTGSGNDRLIGGAGNDYLFGGRGNDAFIAGPSGLAILDSGTPVAGDYYNGGPGTDTVIFSAPRRSYSLNEVIGKQFIGRDSNGLDSSTFVKNIEIAQFLDGRLVYDEADPIAAAYRMYDAAFNREPDSFGLNYWASRLQGGTLIDTVAAGFSGSSEFQQTYGSLSSRGFVQQLYRNVLNREGELQGVNDWTRAIDAGSLSREQVLAGFSESPEHVQLLRPAVTAGLWDQSEVAASIARLYYATLDRAPDSGGLINWTTARENGQSLEQIAGGFTRSEEFQLRYGSLTDGAFVDLLYRNVLDRPADPVGRSNWLQFMANGMNRDQVVLGFSESLEFQLQTQSVIDNGIFFL